MIESYSKNPYKFLWRIWKPFPIATFSHILVIMGIPILCFFSPRFAKKMVEQLTMNSLDGFLFYAKSSIALGIFVAFIYRIHFYFVLTKMLPAASIAIGNEFISSLNKKNSFYLNNTSGEISNAMNLLNTGFSRFVEESQNIMTPIFVLIFGSFSLWLISPRFAIATISWFSIFVILILITRKESSIRSGKYYKQLGSNSGYLVDLLSNIFTIKIYNSWLLEKQFLEKRLEKSAIKYEDMMNLDSITRWGYSIGAVLLQIFNLSMIYIQVKNGKLKPTDCIIILSTNDLILNFCWRIHIGIVAMRQLVSQISEGLKIMEADLEEEKDLAPNLIIKRGDIEFDHVTFGYGEDLLFKDESVLIRGRSKVALVGSSGAGKSTFINLLLRIVEVTDGKVKIDGQDIREVNKKSLYDSISFVPQNLILFNRTILQNIIYPNKIINEKQRKEVIKAAELALIHDFIENLPDGYNTLVSEGSKNISGGQKQRILIARAFFKNSPIVILDEFSSALDIKTEDAICSNIAEMTDKTFIIITHRNKILSFVDKILFLENGKIVENGSLEELIALNGKFAELFKKQESLD